MAPDSTLAGIVCAAFLVLAGWHVYMALMPRVGAGASGAVPSVGGKPLFVPPRQATLAVALVVLGSSALPAESGTPPSAVAKLAHTGEVACQPALPYFCSNLHVACAGQTSMKAFAFKLKSVQAQGTIESAPDPDNVLLQYDNGRIEWDRDGAYALLIPPQGSGYIKLLSDGSYSVRHYAPRGAVMSIGRCS
jgi:hypothetical protein